ncbi:MAG: glycosyltransferase [Gammaproteobacteria bacterium]
MRVLHIGKYFAPFKGGVETYMMDVMRALTRLGCECMALVHRHDRSLRDLRERPDGPQGFGVVRAATWFTAFFTPISPGFPFTLWRVLRSFRPDVVHVHLPNPSACWLLLTPGARRANWMVHWHSDVITARLGWAMRVLYALYRPLERRLLRRADAIVATSESYLETSESLADFPDKCHVIPLGLDPGRLDDRAAADERALVGGEPLRVLAVGRLTYYKGFGYLLRALARTEGVILDVVGEGELERELKAMAGALDLRERVTFHHAVNDQRLAKLLRDCDCLCLPSIERTEAFGLVLLEAMAFSRATVASRVRGSGMAWVVEDGVTGLLVAPADESALAAALERLRDDPELARRLGRNGRRRFDEEFHIDRSAQRLEELYGKLCAGHAGLAPP